MDVLTLFGVLTFGTFAFWGFWSIFFVATCILVGLTENENWGWASTIIVVGFIGMGVSGIFNAWDYATTHKALLFWRVLEYIGVGIVWACCKWWRYVKKQKNTYDEARKSFLSQKNAIDFTDELRVAWTKFLATNSRAGYRRDGIEQAPEASNHKETLTNWMAFWPFSMLGTLLYDFLRELWDAIYDALAGVLDSIAKAIYKDVAADLMTEEQYAASKVKASFEASKADKN